MALHASIPRLMRSSLHRCLQRHGISRLPEVVGDKEPKRKFKTYPIGYFHIDIAEVRTAEGKLRLYVEIDRTSKCAFVRLADKVTWTNGQVERMNRTIKEATVKHYHYDSHTQLTAHLRDSIDAYNYGRRLKTLRGLTPYEYVCKIWENEPERFILNPHHQMPRLNN